MRRAGRAGTVVLLAAGSCLVGFGTAHADSATPVAAKTNWYWSSATLSVEGNKLPVAPPTQATGVPDGDLGVGYVPNQTGAPDKVAAVSFDLSSVPLGSTFSSLRVTVPYDPSTHQLADGNPDISACELLDAFSEAPGPTPMAQVPPMSLPSCVKGVFNATAGKSGGYVFDLTAMANDWSGGAPANGVLLAPTSASPTQPPFSISLLGKNGITSTAEYTAAPAPVPTEETVAPPLPNVAPPPPAPGYVAPPSLPGSYLPQPSVVPNPAPQVNAVPTRAAVASVAYHQGALVPSGAWWLGFLAVLGLLGLTAVVLGDPMTPVTVDPRRRRFAEVVRVQARPVAATPARVRQPSPRFRPA